MPKHKKGRALRHVPHKKADCATLESYAVHTRHLCLYLYSIMARLKTQEEKDQYSGIVTATCKHCRTQI